MLMMVNFGFKALKQLFTDGRISRDAVSIDFFVPQDVLGPEEGHLIEDCNEVVNLEGRLKLFLI